MLFGKNEERVPGGEREREREWRIEKKESKKEQKEQEEESAAAKRVRQEKEAAEREHVSKIPLSTSLDYYSGGVQSSHSIKTQIISPYQKKT